MFIRFVGPYVFATGSFWQHVVLVGTILLSPPIVKLLGVVGQLGDDQILPVLSLCITVAAWLDGLGVTYFQDVFYGSDPVIAARGAAWILFGIGCFNLVALYTHCKAAVADNPSLSTLSVNRSK